MRTAKNTDTVELQTDSQPNLREKAAQDGYFYVECLQSGHLKVSSQFFAVLRATASGPIDAHRVASQN